MTKERSSWRKRRMTKRERLISSVFSSSCRKDIEIHKTADALKLSMPLSAVYLPAIPLKDQSQLTSSPLLRSYAISQRWSGS